MNAENFAEYLKNPALLYQLSYEELKTLALQYPFSQNIQYLLLIKSKLENHKEYEKNLVRAAAGMTDRTHLYRKLKELSLGPLDSRELISTEEVLELKELSALEKDLREQVPRFSEEEPVLRAEALMDLSFPSIHSHPEIEEEEEDIELNFPIPEIGEAAGEDPNQQEQEAAAGFRVSQQEMATMAAFDQLFEIAPASPTDEGLVVVPEPEEPSIWAASVDDLVSVAEMLDLVLPRFFAHIPPPAPLPKAAFRSWKRKIHVRPIIAPPIDPHSSRSDESSEEPAMAKEAPKKKKQKTKVLEIAAASIVEKRGIASETLARLLENQGQYQKAIKMYEQLILTIPEKSGYFAQQIEKLKNL